MIEIYYTGSLSFNEEQKDKDKSLGGFLSSTKVPNDILSNLFGDISLYTLEERLRETRAIILFNNSEYPIIDLESWIDIPEGTLGKYSISTVNIEPDSQGEVYMESITNVRGAPFNSNFHQLQGEDSKLLLSEELPPGGFMGVWLRREITDSDLESISCSTDDTKKLPTKSFISLCFSWDD